MNKIEEKLVKIDVVIPDASKPPGSFFRSFKQGIYYLRLAGFAKEMVSWFIKQGKLGQDLTAKEGMRLLKYQL